jgi:hypothetical protein
MKATAGEPAEAERAAGREQGAHSRVALAAQTNADLRKHFPDHTDEEIRIAIAQKRGARKPAKKNKQTADGTSHRCKREKAPADSVCSGEPHISERQQTDLKHGREPNPLFRGGSRRFERAPYHEQRQEQADLPKEEQAHAQKGLVGIAAGVVSWLGISMVSVITLGAIQIQPDRAALEVEEQESVTVQVYGSRQAEHAAELAEEESRMRIQLLLNRK